MDRIRPVWEHLYNPQRHTLFQTFAWNQLAAQQFSHRDAPFVAVVESDSGAAIIPGCVVGNSHLGLLGDMLFDYRAILHQGAPEVLEAAFARLGELDLPVEITAVRDCDLGPFAQFEPAFFTNAPSVQRQNFTSEQFAAEHSRLGRFFRRLAKQRVELQQSFGDQQALVRWIYERKAQQFADSALDIFSDPARVEFMVRAAALDPAKFEIFTFATAGRVIAALVTLRDAHVRRLYTVWFDHEWAQFSPGTVLVFAITQRSLAEGLDCDFMTGEQPHKLRLATSLTRLFKIAGQIRTAVTARETAAEVPALVEDESLPQAAD